MKLPKVLTSRRVVQWSTALIMAGVGVHYSWWIGAHLQGRWPSVSRPVGVEAFLPIDGMLGFRHWLLSGVVDTVHPAALAIFVMAKEPRYSFRDLLSTSHLSGT